MEVATGTEHGTNGHQENGFKAADGRYSQVLEGGAIEFELDYVRRDDNQLKGELLVRCFIPGVYATNGVLTVADLNVSSIRSRNECVKYLVDRSGRKDIAWADYLEEFCTLVLASNRAGQTPVVLSSLDKPGVEEELNVLGLTLPWKHPAVMFGDGGSTKSMLALAIACKLARRGLTVLYADWELDEEQQRLRQERLCGLPLPPVLYVRCMRPLAREAETLRHLVKEQGVDYVIYDSVSFACDGAPEHAEVAVRYFQAVRHIGPIGSLHVAHVSKALEGAELKPFGSSFWHNGFRSSWNVKRSESMPNDPAVRIAVHNRKENCGPIHPSVGFELTFDAERTHIKHIDIAAVPELAAGLPIRQALKVALKDRGPQPVKTLADELDAKSDTIRKIVSRNPREFRLIDGKVALSDVR